MKLREACIDDVWTLNEWFIAQEDCLNTINKSTFSEEDFLHWLKATDQHCFILEESRQPIAYGEVWVDDEGRDLEFAHLVVAPNSRNQGVGRKLVLLLEGKAQQYHYPWIYIRVRPENEVARRCYKGAGFLEDSSLRELFDENWVWLKKENFGGVF
ncbi:ribosomal protein S18 acetylase RimI-like enzyme [Bacillus pakistanensis]|uniref:Ribosomal protein S18 acetylase RimI-like enzyme n=1 Tax=Rossellomorea pakistanensis TaxID=992288 RepID=A0ABS2NHL9_9BACI|nr:GNAT family N-acetyltransferase [Bacillus pakistanensis]MBM7587036.1 ribosomal protein S18 acetylase RimI-like enzyme [Bacillus pakistanensis]